MNFDEYFSQADFHSTGNFGISQRELLRKLGQFQLSQPEHGPLALIAAALVAGTRRIEVDVRGSDVQYRFVGASEPDLEHGKGPGQKLLWAAAANQHGVRALHLACPGQGVTVVRKRSDWNVEPLAQKKSNSSSPDNALLLAIRRHGRASDLEVLTRSCSLCPVPLVLNGETLQIPLTACHPRVEWSPTVPELFVPQPDAAKQGSLETDLALAWIDRGPSVAVVGGIAYPFTLPGWIRGAAVGWNDRLRPDLGLVHIVQDEAWSECERELLRVARQLHRREG